jgi:hypothetical protein
MIRLQKQPPLQSDISSVRTWELAAQKLFLATPSLGLWGPSHPICLCLPKSLNPVSITSTDEASTQEKGVSQTLQNRPT